MFIELTWKITKKKFCVNVDKIRYFTPLNEKDGYGHPQTGTAIFYDNSETYTEVAETCETIIGLIRK